MAEDFSSYSDDELVKMYHESKTLAQVFDLSQLAKKILLNSCYGAIGNAYFLHNDVKIARAITLMGQAMINKAAKAKNDYINKILNNKEYIDYRTYSDTDSVAGDTKINIDGKDILIEDFYNEYEGTIVNNGTGKEIKRLNSDCYVTSWNGDSIVNTKVIYVMKHYVKKEMYKITFDDNSAYVVVTNNHSIMYYRDDILYSGTVFNIKKSDEIVLNGKRTKNWNINFEYILTGYVYDIETENHMFFANNILVHNSNYIELKDVVDKFLKIKPNADRQEQTDFLDKFCHKIEDDCLTPLFVKVKEECNGHKDGELHMDREAIATPSEKTGYCGLWIAKKRYYLLLDDMEGFRYTANGHEPHEKIMGLFSVTSTCPEFIKPYFNKVMYNLCSEGVDEARKTIKELKDIFFHKSVADIAFPKGVTDVDKFINPDTKLPWDGEWLDSGSGKTRNGGVPINAKAAIYHNYLVDKLGLEKKYQKIKSGDKMKYVYLTENPYKYSVIGFLDDMPEEFGLKKYVDYNTHYEKLFLSPVTDIFTACSLEVEPQASIDDFF